MAEKSQQLVVQALRRMMAEPAGLPVFAGKSAAGLFPANAAGRQAAQYCQEQGWLRAVRSETRGKTAIDICTLSDQGIAFVLEQDSPREVLEEFVQALETRREQLDSLLDSVRTSQQTLTALAESARKVLDRLETPTPAPAQPAHTTNGFDHAGLVLERLRAFHDGGALEDCPLPKLFHLVGSGWTIGAFHDCLRTLHREHKIYLHPWTGALYEMPEPAFGLLIGHEIAYYASLRA